jgi:hypothetical protein
MSGVLTRNLYALNNRSRDKDEPVFDYACKMTSLRHGYLPGGWLPYLALRFVPRFKPSKMCLSCTKQWCLN